MIGGKQRLQRLLAVRIQVLTSPQQHILLAFDVALVLAFQAGIFVLADLIQRILETS
ncbi:MAG: hypothetical protein VB137_15135 [Burkholderia sp.]